MRALLVCLCCLWLTAQCSILLRNLSRSVCACVFAPTWPLGLHHTCWCETESRKKLPLRCRDLNVLQIRRLSNNYKSKLSCLVVLPCTGAHDFDQKFERSGSSSGLGTLNDSETQNTTRNLNDNRENGLNRNNGFNGNRESSCVSYNLIPSCKRFSLAYGCLVFVRLVNPCLGFVIGMTYNHSRTAIYNWLYVHVCVSQQKRRSIFVKCTVCLLCSTRQWAKIGAC